MKLIFSLLILFFFSLNSFSETRELMVGTTQTERELRWTWKYLKEFTLSCSVSEECQDPEVLKVITELNLYLPFFNEDPNSRWSSLLKFVSEKENPDLFNTNNGESHRLAVTETNKFSPVYINTDRMHLPLEQLVGIITHEVIHHLGYLDNSARLPDRVGAAVAAHFQKRILISNFEQYNLPWTRSLIFNSRSERLSIGFWSIAEDTYDIEWGDTLVVRLCSSNEIASRQYVSNPSWKPNRFRATSGIVTLRGGGFVSLMCKNLTTGLERRTQLFIGAEIDLQYPAPLDLKNWTEQTPTLLPENARLGTTDFLGDGLWGPNQSFIILSTQHEKLTFVAGETWRSRILVQSLDGFKPKSCEVYFTGLNWSFWKHTGLPAPDMFNFCNLTELSNNQWQLDVEYKLPPNMQPDQLYMFLVRFPDRAGDRYAIPSAPVFVKVESPQALPAATFDSLDILGLTPIDSYNGSILKSSYKAKNNQTFQVQVFVKGEQELRDSLWSPVIGSSLVGVTVFVHHSNGLANIIWNGPPEQLSQIFTGIDFTKTSTGTRVTFNVRMPENFMGHSVATIKLDYVAFPTADHAWVEKESLDINEFVIVNENSLGH